jgi:hypothetical protein
VVPIVWSEFYNRNEQRPVDIGLTKTRDVTTDDTLLLADDVLLDFSETFGGMSGTSIAALGYPPVMAASSDFIIDLGLKKTNMVWSALGSLAGTDATPSKF